MRARFWIAVDVNAHSLCAGSAADDLTILVSHTAS